jgi:hypothetical protein
VLHGYCIRMAGQPGPSGCSGVDGAVVELIEDGGLGIWLSRGAVPGVTAPRLQEHEIVVRRALQSATPLPLRFGSTFRDEDEVLRLLSDRRDELRDQLARFENRVEMGVRISSRNIGAPPAIGPADSESVNLHATGKAYLEARRRALQSAESEHGVAEGILKAVAAELTVSDDEYVIEVLATSASLGSMAHLLHRRDLPHYRSKLLGVQERWPDLRISASGPWAPYSFV